MRILAFTCMLPFVTAAAIGAQELPPPDTLAADTTVVRGPTPRAAFIRSIVVPGWGQGTLGAYRRGAFFFALRSSSTYMLLKSIARLGEATLVADRMTGLATDSLLTLMAQDTAVARQLEDPIAFEDAVSEHDGVDRSRRLVDVRRRHRQDWIVYSIFFMFLDALDAYVATHLADYPLEFSASPRSEGGASLTVRVPVGRR